MKKTLLLLLILTGMYSYGQVVAVNDSLTLFQARVEIIDPLANDTFPPTDSVYVVLADSNVHFTVIDPHHIRYASDSSYTGVETVRYALCDSAGCDTAAIVITVIPDNGYHYIPMPTSAVHAAWNGFQEGMEDGLHFRQLNDAVYLHGDTMINGMRYSAIYSEPDESGIFLYAMREDSSRKVYFRYTDHPTANFDTIEHMLYDFSMNVGDSFYDTALAYQPKVTSIDTINTPGGLRRRFHIANLQELGQNTRDSWIEGVGSLEILINAPLQPFEVWYCLSTMSIDSQMVFQDTLSCHLILGVADIHLQHIRMYPSPASRQLTIDMEQNTDAITATYHSIDLINMLGQRVKSITRNCNSKTVHINVTDLPEGIYNATITDAAGDTRMLGRFTIER